uniref:Uncharacterized protein n=1 Tax=Bionectria ochroleuca TaxID=29856 RepID=A0A8H7NED1_BIOOC
MGSNGEAPHLSIEERSAIIRETRSCLESLDGLGKPETPIIAGCSGQSFRGGMSPDVIERFFIAVVEQLPIPIILYSSPGVSAGIEMDSGLPGRISQHPNVAGTKFTCGDTGKLSRAATAMKSRQTYAIFGGLADFILPALVAGATGVIAGGANVTPKTCVKVFDLWREGKVEVRPPSRRVPIQSDAAIARIKQSNVPAHKNWASALTQGSLDAELALLIVMTPNLISLSLEKTCTHQVSYFLATVEAVLLLQKECPSWMPSFNTLEVWLPQSLSYICSEEAALSSGLKLLYVPNITALSVKIGVKDLFGWPRQPAPNPTSLKTLKLWSHEAPDFSHLLLSTPNLKKLEWVYFCKTDNIQLDALIEAFSLISETLTCLTIVVPCGDEHDPILFSYPSRRVRFTSRTCEAS